MQSQYDSGPTDEQTGDSVGNPIHQASRIRDLKGAVAAEKLVIQSLREQILEIEAQNPVEEDEVTASIGTVSDLGNWREECSSLVERDLLSRDAPPMATPSRNNKKELICSSY